LFTLGNYAPDNIVASTSTALSFSTNLLNLRTDVKFSSLSVIIGGNKTVSYVTKAVYNDFKCEVANDESYLFDAMCIVNLKLI
jgi:hypothetical protein